MEHIRPKWLKSTKGAPFTGIGSLEADILAIIWERQRATVRDVYETLREQRTIAYTTVMTVMNNLVKKELLTQDRTSIAYVYTPAIPGNEVASTILDSVVAAPVPRAVQPRPLAPARPQARPQPRAGRGAAQVRRGALRRLTASGPPAAAARHDLARRVARRLAARSPTPVTRRRPGSTRRRAPTTCSAARSPRAARDPWPASCAPPRTGPCERPPPRGRR